MDWIHNLFTKKEEIQKEAELINASDVWERKVKANDWIEDTMKLDEDVIHQEEQAKDAKELEVRAAYTMGDSMEETIEKDYELRVKGLSNYNLAEMLAEYIAKEEGLATLSVNEIKDKQLKSIEGNREAAEKKLLDHVGKHSMIDWKEAFEKFKKEAEHVEPKKEDLHPEIETKKQSWEKKDHSELQEAPSDKERVESMEGVGKSEEKGQVGKEAAMTDLSIWHSVEGWNVRARFDTEAEARAAHGWMLGQSVKPSQLPATPEALESSKLPKVEKKACRVGEKVYYRGHPVIIKEIFINKYSTEPHVDVEIEGEVLSLSGKEIDQLGDEPLMPEMTHKDVKVEEPKVELSEPKKEEIMEEEIVPLASKQETLKKVAEVMSPWEVTKDAQGNDIIIRREIKKETKENEDKDLKK